MRAIVAENRPRSAVMRNWNSTLLLALGLSITSSGCIVLARETYTTLRGPDAVAIDPDRSFEVSPGREGHALSHSPSLARASFAGGASVTAAVCDWDDGVWFVVFPPLPIPLLSPGNTAGRPGTTVLRLTLAATESWRTSLAAIALEGEGGVRVAPSRYELVTEHIDDSLEPCSADVAPGTSIDGAELAIFGDAEIWLSFPTLDWPELPRALEIDGLHLDGRPLPRTRLEFEPGARWFWYQLFP